MLFPEQLPGPPRTQLLPLVRKPSKESRGQLRTREPLQVLAGLGRLTPFARAPNQLAALPGGGEDFLFSPRPEHQGNPGTQETAGKYLGSLSIPSVPTGCPLAPSNRSF